MTPSEMEANRIICRRAASKLTWKRQAVWFDTSLKTVQNLHGGRMLSKRAGLSELDIEIIKIAEDIKKEFLAIASKLSKKKSVKYEVS